MSYCARIAAIMLGFGLALAPAGMAHATTTGLNGTYTYNVSLPNGATFSLTQSGPFGNVGTTTLSTSFNGSPMDGYLVTNISSGTGDNGTWSELQFQYAEPDAPDSNTAASILSFTFTEPDSFWTLIGEHSFPADGTTTYGGLLYMNRNLDGSWVDPSDIGADFISGTVNQGAYFNTYTPAGPVSDPLCTSCSVDVIFTPSVSAIPEPSMFTLLGTGVAGVIGVYRRRRRS